MPESAATPAWADDLSALEQLLREIVEIPSFHQDLPGCRRVLQHLAPELEALGLACELEELGARGVPALRARKSGPGARLFLLGHADTVHPEAEGFLRYTPIAGDPERARGPGAADMKGGLVVLLGALRRLAAREQLADAAVEVLVVSDEELGSPDSETAIREAAARADLCLTFEPGRPVESWRRATVVIARRGCGQVDVRAEGRPAHAGVAPEEGASAVLELADKTVRLSVLGESVATGHVTIGLLNGGSSPNTVPAEASFSIDYRFDDAETGTRLREEISRILEEPRVKNPDGTPRVAISVASWHTREALEPLPGTERPRALLAAAAREMGLEIVEERRGGSSDAALAAEVGCPAICGLGVVGDAFHTHDEWIHRRSLADRAELAARLISGWLAEATPRPDRASG